MNRARINIIAVVGKNGELGKDNKLLWSLQSDLQRFKALTMGHPIIIGRKTFESIGKALPGRTNIVITRNRAFAAAGCVVTHSLTDAIWHAESIDAQIFVIGGGEIYKETIGLADRLYLTVVNDSPPADTFFPKWSAFNKILNKEEVVDPQSKLQLTFLTLEK